MHTHPYPKVFCQPKYTGFSAGGASSRCASLCDKWFHSLPCVSLKSRLVWNAKPANAPQLNASWLLLSLAIKGLRLCVWGRACVCELVNVCKSVCLWLCIEGRERCDCVLMYFCLCFTVSIVRFQEFLWCAYTHFYVPVFVCVLVCVCACMPSRTKLVFNSLIQCQVD